MLVKLAAEEMAAGKEVTYSYPKAEYDRAAMEYLGEPITQYETRKTTLTQAGNVESTGWGMLIPDFMVLTHLEQLGENHYKGVFSVYGNGYGQGGDPAEAYEDCCNRLMHGNILPTDFLMGTRTLEWEEWKARCWLAAAVSLLRIHPRQLKQNAPAIRRAFLRLFYHIAELHRQHLLRSPGESCT